MAAAETLHLVHILVSPICALPAWKYVAWFAENVKHYFCMMALGGVVIFTKSGTNWHDCTLYYSHF